MTMSIEQPKTRNVEELSPADARLEEVVRIIVNDFNGDTLAYFNSIRPSSPFEESEEREAFIARRFAKSI